MEQLSPLLVTVTFTFYIYSCRLGIFTAFIKLYAKQYISENGSYFYTISKHKSKENDISDLQSVLINSRPKQCLTFWYHMYGTHINTLKVFQVENTTLNLLWNKSDSQGNKWHFKFLSLNDTGPYHIMFRATRGKGIKSEIAVDDISIHNSDCKNGMTLTSL